MRWRSILRKEREMDKHMIKQRMDRRRLNIGTYTLRPYARTEKHIKELAECGIDFVVCMENDREALKLFEKYGLGAIVSGIVPGWFGGDGSNAGQLSEINTLDKYENGAVSFQDSPAIWGIDVGDEPSAADFPHFGKAIALVNKSFAQQFAYLNIYPNYGVNASNSPEDIRKQLGTKDYKAYISAYCDNVDSDYICLDYYPYAAGEKRMYESLCVAADACRETNRSLWCVLQVNSHEKNVWISLNKLRFQAFLAMTFGAENIIWACYTGGWWYNHVLDQEGKQTCQYERLKQVNAEIRKLAEGYMEYKRVSTYFVGRKEGVITEETFENDVFKELRADDDSFLVVGEFVCGVSGGSALMVLAAGDYMDCAPYSCRIVFRTGQCRIAAEGVNGTASIETLSDGSVAVRIKSNEVLWIRALQV